MRKIDARGETCPIPVIRAKNELKQMADKEQLNISVDNKIATENLGKLAEELGYGMDVIEHSAEHFDVIITKASDLAVSKRAAKKRTVVVFSSNKMGEGVEELGESLMKAFIYSLTESESKPDELLFYNNGAYLTTEGSLSLQDLASLEAVGVRISTCGACLNFYKLENSLKVGSVTNMYKITEAMLSADLVIKP